MGNGKAEIHSFRQSLDPHVRHHYCPWPQAVPAQPKVDSFAEGVIIGIQDFKEGQMTYFIDAEDLADYLRNL